MNLLCLKNYYLVASTFIIIIAILVIIVSYPDHHAYEQNSASLRDSSGLLTVKDHLVATSLIINAELSGINDIVLT